MTPGCRPDGQIMDAHTTQPHKAQPCKAQCSTTDKCFAFPCYVAVRTARWQTTPRLGTPPRLLASVIAASLCLVLASWPATACEQPLYRQALTSASPAPYEVYFIAEGPVPVAQQQVLEQIERLIHHGAPEINLSLTVANVQDDPGLTALRPDIRQLWRRKRGSEPKFLVVNPAGLLVHDGPLNSADVERLANSSVRDSICESLEAGAAGVLVLLKGRAPHSQDVREPLRVARDEVVEQNRRALGELEGLVQQIKQLGMPPEAFAAGAQEPVRASALPFVALPAFDPMVAATYAPSPVRQTLRVVELERDEISDPWLVNALLAVEPDLNRPEYLHQPMVFVLYGRARALPPYIGQGISRENLLRELQYLTQVCACSAKDPLPGTDLLTSYPWRQVAWTVAEPPPPVSEMDRAVDGTNATAEMEPGESHDATDADGRAGAENQARPQAHSDAATSRIPRVAPRRTARVRPARTSDPLLFQDDAIGKVCRNRYCLLGSLGVALLGLVGAFVFILRPRARV